MIKHYSLWSGGHQMSLSSFAAGFERRQYLTQQEIGNLCFQMVPTSFLYVSDEILGRSPRNPGSDESGRFNCRRWIVTLHLLQHRRH